jgi:ABC-2 type transport system permease protein
MVEPRRLPRLLVVVWWLQLRMLAVSAFEGFMQIVWPLIFATSALLMFRANGDQQALIYAGLGAATMGIWSAMATTGSNILQEERWSGTLQLLVAAPTPFAVILMPIALAMATIGLFSVVVTLLWARLLFGITIPVDNPAAFVVSLLVTVLAMAMLGFLLSVSVVRYRTAWAVGNMLEFPGWLLCGFLVPVATLPDWAHPISLVLAPTWGVAAMREAAAGRSAWLDMAVCAALGIGYGLIGALISGTVLTSARRHATLSLT